MIGGGIMGIKCKHGITGSTCSLCMGYKQSEPEQCKNDVISLMDGKPEEPIYFVEAVSSRYTTISNSGKPIVCPGSHQRGYIK